MTRDPAVRRAQKRYHYAANREVDLARQRVYYVHNKEAIAERKREHYKANKAAAAAYRVEHKEEIAASQRAYHLAHREIKSAQARVRNSAVDKIARAAQQRVKYAMNPYPALNRSHKRRAAKSGNQDGRRVTTKELVSMFNRQLGCCFYCTSKTPLTQEHVIPVSRGGRHAAGNMVLVCKRCNNSKCGRTVMEWKRSRGWLGQVPPFAAELLGSEAG